MKVIKRLDLVPHQGRNGQRSFDMIDFYDHGGKSTWGSLHIDVLHYGNSKSNDVYKRLRNGETVTVAVCEEEDDD